MALLSKTFLLLHSFPDWELQRFQLCFPEFRIVLPVGGINASRFLHQTISAFWGPAPNSSSHLPVRLLQGRWPAHLWERAALRLWTREGAALTEAFKAAEMFLYPSPDLRLQTNLSGRFADDSFDFTPGLCSDMHHQHGTLYRQACEPFQIMSSQLNLPQMESSEAAETSGGWPGECTWAQSLDFTLNLCGCLRTRALCSCEATQTTFGSLRKNVAWSYFWDKAGP